MTAPDRARTHEVLSAPSRVAILDLLRDSAGPLDARELAAATGLHVTTVRFHVTALIEAGLVTERHERGGGRGRPRAVYSASWADGPEHGPYQELADLLARHFAGTPAQRARRAERAGEEWAERRLGPSTAPAADARSAVTAMFAEMGFDPEQTPDGRVLLHDCPFRATARAHPEVVCNAHRGLLRSALERLDPGGPGLDLHPFVRPGLCVITPAGAAPSR